MCYRLATCASIALLIAFLIAALAPAVGAQTVRYVNAAATGANNGTSWADAFTDLQAALAAAGSGDQLWIAAGVYRPTVNPFDRFAHFRLKNGVALFGGFAGTESSLNQRNFVYYRSILSGDIDKNDMNHHGVTTTIYGENSYHVVVGSGVDSTAVIDGIIITGGQATGFGQAGAGGGLKNEAGSSPTLRNSSLSGNSAEYGGAMHNSGGSSPSLTKVAIAGNSAILGAGMFNEGASAPTLTNVEISGNLATSLGGGMYNLNSNPKLTGVNITGNQAPGTGGGMANVDSSPILTTVTFSGNRAAFGAGMANLDDSSPALTHVTFNGNTATSGGGMFNTGTGTPTLVRVTFDRNSAASDGGAMYNDGSYGRASSPVLVNVTFSGNSARGQGGAMANFGIGGTSSPTLTNVVFVGNDGLGGGAIYNRASGGTASPILTNVTFTRNSATSGGAIYNFTEHDGTSSPALTNVILWGNTAGGGGHQIHNHGANPTISHSLIQDGIAGISENGGSWSTDGGSNLNANPLFVNVDGPTGADGVFGTEHDGLRLIDGSPAIDAGNTEAIPHGITTDMSGIQRVQGAAVDIGAYEFGSPVSAEPVSVPQAYVLSTAFPNPFNSETTFALSISQSQQVSVNVYDVLGRQVRTLFSGDLAAGEQHWFTFDADHLAAGTYLIHAVGERFTTSRLVTLVR